MKTRTPKPTIHSAAVLTIKDAGNMTPAGRRAIARWLDKQKAFFLKYGKDYSAVCRARYLYEKLAD